MKKLKCGLDCLIILTSLGLGGCGSGSQSTSSAAQVQQGQQPQAKQQPMPTPPTAPEDNGPSFQYFSTIREFGGNDSAALFGLLPNKLGMKITGITGPLFLGHARVEVLNRETLGDLFSSSSRPMPTAEKEQLISQYNGAQIIYFEKYQGQLCKDDDLTLTVTSNFGSRSPVLTFKFSAVPDSSGDCRFHSLVLETTN